jgi:hypothetical protein
MSSFPILNNISSTLKNWSIKLAGFSKRLTLVINDNEEIKINRDIEVTDSSSGLILQDINGNRWKITINTSGTIVTTNL